MKKPPKPLKRPRTRLHAGRTVASHSHGGKKRGSRGVAVGRVRLARGVASARPTATRPVARWNPNPEDVERSVARLVLALVEFIRKLLERQAVRRMEKGTLSRREVEALGIALMRLERTLHKMARRFGLSPADLNLDLGPVGRLT